MTHDSVIHYQICGQNQAHDGWLLSSLQVFEEFSLARAVLGRFSGGQAAATRSLEGFSLTLTG